MSLSFTRDWLSLREPADHAARAPSVTAAALAFVADRPAPLIVDVGCGRGSNIRFLRDRLPADTRWRLVDHDADLLGEAATQAPPGAAVETCQLDLRTVDLSPVVAHADLVTAAALIDLVSGAWLRRLVAAARAAGAGLLVTGSVDGRVLWQPALPADATLHGTYVAHQGGDKGFGAALGTAAPAALEHELEAAGWRTTAADADWAAVTDGELQRAYLDGVAAALAETPCDRRELEAWLAQRRHHIDTGESRLTVGHRDVFAAPSGS